MRYRLTDSAANVPIHIDGEACEVPGDRSLLAGLLARAAPIDFLCAIGQCQRCVVRVNGREQVACLTVPRPGDEVETPARWRDSGS